MKSNVVLVVVVVLEAKGLYCEGALRFLYSVFICMKTSNDDEGEGNEKVKIDKLNKY